MKKREEQRKKAEEKARQEQAERQRQLEEQKRRAEEEANRQRQMLLEQRQRQAEEEARRKQAEMEEAKRRAENEERMRKLREAEERLRKAEEEARQREAEQQKRQWEQQQQEEMRRRADDLERKKQEIEKRENELAAAQQAAQQRAAVPVQPSPSSTNTTTTTTTTTQTQTQTLVYPGSDGGGVARKNAQAAGPEAARKFDEKVQKMLQTQTSCPNKYKWYVVGREGGAYLCGDGNHFIESEEIDKWTKNPSYQPKFQIVNTWVPTGVHLDKDSGYTITLAAVHPPDVDKWQLMHKTHANFVNETAPRGWNPTSRKYVYGIGGCKCFLKMGIYSAEEEAENPMLKLQREMRYGPFPPNGGLRGLPLGGGGGFRRMLGGFGPFGGMRL
jgi:hypothetical protein